MKTLKHIIVLLLIVATTPIFAQSGQYNIRLSKHDADFNTLKYYVDIELKAANENSTFAVSHQNYRFTYSPDQLANPQIDQELTLSGAVNGKNSTSLYGTHTLKGTKDNLVSYNITLDGGDGYTIGHEEYTKVGRLVFDIVDAEADFELKLNTPKSGNTPSIAIIEKGIDGQKAVTPGATYNLTSSDFDVHVYLEGPYDPSTGLMATTLNQLGLLPGQTPTKPFFTPTPAGNPYNGAPWNHPTTTAVTTYDATVVDYVLLSLRTDYFATSFVFKTVALLHNDGRVEPLEAIDWSTLPQTPLYVSIQTRNHMTIMTDQPVARDANGTISHDFRHGNAWQGAAGFGQKEITPGVFAMYSGDIDHENADINGMDGIVISAENGKFGIYSPADFDMNGDVSGADKILWSQNNGLSNFLFE